MDPTLIRKAEADLRQAELKDQAAEAAIERAQAERTGTQAQVARMQGVLEWLRQQDEPQEDATSPAVTPATPAGDRSPSVPEPGPAMNNNQRVYWAVERLGGVAFNTEVIEHLDQAGYNLTPAQVRESAKYLARKGKFVSAGRGRWQIPRATLPAASGAVPAMNGVRGES